MVAGGVSNQRIETGLLDEGLVLPCSTYTCTATSYSYATKRRGGRDLFSDVLWRSAVVARVVDVVGRFARVVWGDRVRWRGEVGGRVVGDRLLSGGEHHLMKQNFAVTVLCGWGDGAHRYVQEVSARLASGNRYVSVQKHGGLGASGELNALADRHGSAQNWLSSAVVLFVFQKLEKAQAHILGPLGGGEVGAARGSEHLVAAREDHTPPSRQTGEPAGRFDREVAVEERVVGSTLAAQRPVRLYIHFYFAQVTSLHFPHRHSAPSQARQPSPLPFSPCPGPSYFDLLDLGRGCSVAGLVLESRSEGHFDAPQHSAYPTEQTALALELGRGYIIMARYRRIETSESYGVRAGLPLASPGAGFIQTLAEDASETQLLQTRISLEK